MEAFLGFIIRASIYLLVFGLGYYVLLSRQDHARFKRIFILSSFFVSILLASSGTIAVIPVGATNETIIKLLPEIIVIAHHATIPAEVVASENWLGYFPYAALFLTGIFFIAMLFRFARIVGYIRKNPRQKHEDMELVYLADHYSPFSFFRWIFIPGNLTHSEHFEKVIRHEKAHFRYRHSWDVLFLEALRILFWFHPMWYYLRNQMQELHEFEADSYALQVYSRPDYQKALLDCAIGAHFLPVTNPFNVSTIKKRFVMMNRNEKNNLKSLLYRSLMVIPFLVAVFVIQSCDFNTPEMVEIADVKTEEVIDVDAAFEDDVIFTVVEVDPQFPGGVSELMLFLQSNLRYPETARAEGKAGTIFVTFVVEKTGDISGVRILRGVSPELDEEAKRVVSMMPQWIPAQQRGQAVRVQFNLPIRFVLN
jgi:TonB family protein